MDKMREAAPQHSGLLRAAEGGKIRAKPSRIVRGAGRRPPLAFIEPSAFVLACGCTVAFVELPRASCSSPVLVRLPMKKTVATCRSWLSAVLRLSSDTTRGMPCAGSRMLRGLSESESERHSNGSESKTLRS